MSDDMVHVYRNRPDDDRPASEMTFCGSCGGWYGVPHTGSHCQQQMPAGSGQTGSCACRFCCEVSGRPIEGRHGFFTTAEVWQP